MIVAGRGGNTDTWEPGSLQSDLLGRLGTQGPAPQADTTLNELVAAGVSDLAEHAAGVQAKAFSQRDTALAESDQLREQAERVPQLVEQLEEAQAQVNSLTSDNQELEGKVAYLREHFQAKVEATPSKKARRTKVEGEKGVYFNDTSEGRVYEIGYPDDEGKQRWKTVGPDLEEAIALRRELAGKPFEAKEPVPA